MGCIILSGSLGALVYIIVPIACTERAYSSEQKIICNLRLEVVGKKIICQRLFLDGKTWTAISENITDG